MRFYYSETFEYLIGSNGSEIERRLIEVPLGLRKEYLAPRVTDLGEAGPTVLWDILRTYLDEIEARMAEIARRHTPLYWFHLYRRILPVLSRKHVGKRDDTTVALVRQIAELAYLKHGDQAKTGEIGPIANTSFRTFLGGHYKAAMQRALGSLSAARRRYDEVKATKQWVMLDFDQEDLLLAFEVEGLAYEYWKTSAAMRSLGKGVPLAWNAETKWLEDSGAGPHPLLFALFDHRIDHQSGLYTRLGTWTQLAHDVRESDFATIYFAAYNPNGGVDEYPTWDRSSRQILYGQARLNFRMGKVPIQAFLDAHAFMALAFEKRHKVKLEAVLFGMRIASFFAFFPDRAIFSQDEDERKSIILDNLTNLGFRGYKHIGQTIDTIAEEALWWARAMGEETSLSTNEVRAGFEFLLLDKEAAGLIGLWSGGKRPLLLPAPEGLVIDVAATAPILVNLFFGVREATGAKGMAFEDSARAMLQASGLDLVFSGEIEFHDGPRREIDAAIRVSDRLVLVECFSFERPVDYELAKPGVFQARIARMSEKVEQARTLADAVEKSRSGANFDFSWARTVDWRLATPSVEFAWEFSEDLFDEQGVPRILQLSELSAFLANGHHPGEPLQPVLVTALKRAKCRSRRSSRARPAT